MAYSISTYLAHAKAVLAQVGARMNSGTGTDNKFWHNFKTGPFGAMVNKMAIWEVARQEDAYLKAMKKDRNDVGAVIEARAQAAQTMAAGNCGEQAALAFWYLQQRGVRPLDFVHFTDRDHAFVVLGSRVNITPNNFVQWSVDSVVCDPWGGRAEVAGMLVLRYSSTKIESLYRLP